MSKTMKWILGILIAVLVIGAIGAAGFLVTNRLYGRAWMLGDLDRRSWDGGRIVPRGEVPWGAMPMRPYSRMPGVHLLPFFPFGGFFFWLICLGGLALLVFGIIALVASLSSPKKAVESVSATVPPAPIEAAPLRPAHLCPSCARPVQEDWSHCPYCGSALGG